mgnify:CR=1 FL=1
MSLSLHYELDSSELISLEEEELSSSESLTAIGVGIFEISMASIALDDFLRTIMGASSSEVSDSSSSEPEDDDKLDERAILALVGAVFLFGVGDRDEFSILVANGFAVASVASLLATPAVFLALRLVFGLMEAVGVDGDSCTSDFAFDFFAGFGEVRASSTSSFFCTASDGLLFLVAFRVEVWEAEAPVDSTFGSSSFSASVLMVVTLVFDLDLTIGEEGEVEDEPEGETGASGEVVLSFFFRAEGPGDACGVLSLAFLPSELDLILILPGEEGDCTGVEAESLECVEVSGAGDADEDEGSALRDCTILGPIGMALEELERRTTLAGSVSLPFSFIFFCLAAMSSLSDMTQEMVSKKAMALGLRNSMTLDTPVRRRVYFKLNVSFFKETLFSSSHSSLFSFSSSKVMMVRALESS